MEKIEVPWINIDPDEMRYFCYNECPDGSGENKVVVMSEKEIADIWWGYWYRRMWERFGPGRYCWPDALDEWIVINWAWESKSEG